MFRNEIYPKEKKNHVHVYILSYWYYLFFGIFTFYPNLNLTHSSYLNLFIGKLDEAILSAIEIGKKICTRKFWEVKKSRWIQRILLLCLVRFFNQCVICFKNYFIYSNKTRKIYRFVNVNLVFHHTG